MASTVDAEGGVLDQVMSNDEDLQIVSEYVDEIPVDIKIYRKIPGWYMREVPSKMEAT